MIGEKRSIPKIDTDDFLSVDDYGFPDISTSEIGDLVFRVCSHVYNRRPLVFSNILDPLWLAYLSKLGYTKILLHPKRKERFRRLNASRRTNLKGSDKYYNNELSVESLLRNSYFDIHFEDDNQISDYSATPFTGIGLRGLKYDYNSYVIRMVTKGISRISPFSMNYIKKRVKFSERVSNTKIVLAYSPEIQLVSSQYMYLSSSVFKYLSISHDHIVYRFNSIAALAEFGLDPNTSKKYNIQLADRSLSRGMAIFTCLYVIVPTKFNLRFTHYDLWYSSQTVPIVRDVPNMIKTLLLSLIYILRISGGLLSKPTVNTMV
jgi:hypothetical protein